MIIILIYARTAEKNEASDVGRYILARVIITTKTGISMHFALCYPKNGDSHFSTNSFRIF